MEDGPVVGREDHGLVRGDLDLDDAQRRSLPRVLQPEVECLLTRRVRIAVLLALDDDRERTACAEGRERPLRDPAERRFERWARRRARGGEVEVLGEPVVAEVELLERRAALEDERVSERRVGGDGAEDVADGVVLEDHLDAETQTPSLGSQELLERRHRRTGAARLSWSFQRAMTRPLASRVGSRSWVAWTGTARSGARTSWSTPIVSSAQPRRFATAATWSVTA